MIDRILLKILKSNEFESKLLRKRYLNKHNVKVGLYSYGCFDVSRIPPGTTVGRYCSFSSSCVIFSRNHGLSYISLSPYFYNSRLGMISADTIAFGHCKVEDDVWVGHNAIITPSVRHIGRGAVIAAGAVVTKDVPPYAIVAGNPGKIVRYRFGPDVINHIEETRWWERSKEELANLLKSKPDFIYRPEAFYGNIS